MIRDLPPGAVYLGGGRCRFNVWAPKHSSVAVEVADSETRHSPLKATGTGYHQGELNDARPGLLYKYLLGDGAFVLPDPASRSQPQGVHGPSQLVPSDFPWSDSEWRGLPLADYILYELHTGTFSLSGTFQGIIDHLDRFIDLGITALELMPVAQFTGERNWGYDGVYPFAVQHSYGGLGELKKLVNECHRKGIAVVMDVVFNHLGPEGNYFASYGSYFTDAYQTPWGAAVNFDGPHSDEVRNYFLHNTLFWIEECHIDALRLDAIHSIYDSSPYPFLEELSELVDRTAERLDRHIYLIPETDSNDPRVLRSRKEGFGMHAQWSDDFHHALHAYVTGETQGYYQDYGELNDLRKAFREGFVYTGQYSSYRRKHHGRQLDSVDPRRLVIFSQNHDQVGNRAQGERPVVSFPERHLRLRPLRFCFRLSSLYSSWERNMRKRPPSLISYTIRKTH